MNNPSRLGVEQLQRLVEVGRALVTELDVETILQRVLEAARDLTGAHYAAIGILDERKVELERFITLGVDEETRSAIGSLPRGRGVLGLLIRDPQPLRLDDVGSHAESYGFPPGHPPMGSFLGVPILIRGEAYGNLYLTEKASGSFDELDEEALVVLADWAAIAIDNARLYQGIEARRSELERAVGSLQATSEIARALGGETDLDRVLELIVKRGRALVEARTVMILLLEGDQLVVAATAGEVTGSPAGTSVAVEGSLAGQVLRTQRPERVSDVSSRIGIAPVELGMHDAETALLVPLTFRGASYGVLTAFDRLASGPAFDAEDERLLLSFAASAATAVATARSVAEHRLRAALDVSERERKRWARELHDDTLQGLAALRVMLSTALRQESSEKLRVTAENTVGHLKSEIEKLRALITELRPAALDEIGLRAAIESLVERTKARHGLDVAASIRLASDHGATRLVPDVESTAFRLAQEALTNTAKHAGAEHVRLDLTERDDTLELVIRDDGRGFEPSDSRDGFGLTGMAERVELLRGTLLIDSAPGAGTTVRASLPALHREASDADQKPEGEHQDPAAKRAG